MASVSKLRRYTEEELNDPVKNQEALERMRQADQRLIESRTAEENERARKQCEALMKGDLNDPFVRTFEGLR